MTGGKEVHFRCRGSHSSWQLKGRGAGEEQGAAEGHGGDGWGLYQGERNGKSMAKKQKGWHTRKNNKIPALIQTVINRKIENNFFLLLQMLLQD